MLLLNAVDNVDALPITLIQARLFNAVLLFIVNISMMTCPYCITSEHRNILVVFCRKSFALFLSFPRRQRPHYDGTDLLLSAADLSHLCSREVEVECQRFQAFITNSDVCLAYSEFFSPISPFSMPITIFNFYKCILQINHNCDSISHNVHRLLAPLPLGTLTSKLTILPTSGICLWYSSFSKIFIL